MSPKAAFTGGKLNLKGGNAKKKQKKHKHKDKTMSMTNTPSSAHGLVDPPPEEVPSKRRKLADDEDGSYDGHRGNGSSSSSRSSSRSDHDDEDDQDLTKAERKSLKFKRQQERKDLEKIASLSHRERVEQFNEKIGKLTEHNDIPRVSAAGNG